MSRRHDLRRIKQHRSYTALELCDTLRINIGTVRTWTRDGLRPLPGTWPYLFAAADIVAFLEARIQPRQPLEPGEIHSIACRSNVVPADGIVDLVRRSATSGDLIGGCPRTGKRIFRRVRLSSLEEALGDLKVRCEDETIPIPEARRAPRTEQFEGAMS